MVLGRSAFPAGSACFGANLASPWRFASCPLKLRLPYWLLMVHFLGGTVRQLCNLLVAASLLLPSLALAQADPALQLRQLQPELFHADNTSSASSPTPHEIRLHVSFSSGNSRRMAWVSILPPYGLVREDDR